MMLLIVILLFQCQIVMQLCRNINIIMKIVLINTIAIIHTRASKRFAGLNLYSSIDVSIDTNSIK